jgi:hypothetical protein
MCLQLFSKNLFLYFTAFNLFCNPLSKFHNRGLKRFPPLGKRFVSLYLMKYVYSIVDHSVFYLLSLLVLFYFTTSSHFPKFVNMDPKCLHALVLSFNAVFYFHTFYVTSFIQMLCFKLLLNPISDILQLIFCYIFCISFILCYYNLIIHPTLFTYAFWFISLSVLDKFNYALNCIIIQGERKYAQPNLNKATIQDEVLYKHAFWSVVSDLQSPCDWRTCSKCLQWVPMQALQETDILGLFLSLYLTGAVYR